MPHERRADDMDGGWDLLLKVAAVAVAVATYVASKRREMRLRRAELIRAYTNDFYADQEFLSLFMDIDNDRLDGEPLVGSDRELTVIRMLDFFNAMGHNWRRKVLRLDDLVPTTLGYAALRTWENDSVRAYLRQIRSWDEERYVTGSGFRYFEQLATEIALLCDRPTAPGGILSAPVRRPAGQVLALRFAAVRRARRVLRRIASRTR